MIVWTAVVENSSISSRPPPGPPPPLQATEAPVQCAAGPLLPRRWVRLRGAAGKSVGPLRLAVRRAEMVLPCRLRIKLSQSSDKDCASGGAAILFHCLNTADGPWETAGLLEARPQICGGPSFHQPEARNLACCMPSTGLQSVQSRLSRVGDKAGKTSQHGRQFRQSWACRVSPPAAWTRMRRLCASLLTPASSS